MNTAQRIFDGRDAEMDIENALDEALVDFNGTRFDEYDCSIELYQVPPDYRLSTEAQRIIHAAGFLRAFVNHTDKWETHYSFKPAEDFVEAKGWRVSYPHKRGEGEKGIWVEEVPPAWPQEWVETGYCIIKNDANV